MTIELITGTPGAGKTCYTVNQRMLPESGRTWKVDDVESPFHGQTMTRRIVMAGIRDLSVEHERLPHKLTGEVVTEAEVSRWNKMLGEDLPEYQRLPGAEPLEVPALLQNWWLWCRPGDLIVVDEAQFMMPRGTLGRTPPYYIMALDIHRHYAVDFIFVTQHPNKIATEIRGLVGMHRHVRSVMGSGLCMVYEWDHASNPDRFQMANKSTWLRRAKHYKTYKSAVAHLSPPSSGRKALLLVPLLVIAGFFAVNRIKARLAPSPPVAVAGPVGVVQTSGNGGVAKTLPPLPVAWRDVPKLTGCYTHAGKCSCIGEDGWVVKVADTMCRTSARGFDGLVRWERSTSIPAPEVHPYIPAASSVVPSTLLVAGDSSLKSR